MNNINNPKLAKTEEGKSASYIHAQCSSEDKWRWIQQAKKEELKLTDWIIKHLNASI